MGLSQGFARVLTWMRGHSHGKGARSVRRATMALERLEERSVLAGLPGIEAPASIGSSPDPSSLETKETALEGEEQWGTETGLTNDDTSTVDDVFANGYPADACPLPPSNLGGGDALNFSDADVSAPTEAIPGVTRADGPLAAIDSGPQSGPQASPTGIQTLAGADSLDTPTLAVVRVPMRPVGGLEGPSTGFRITCSPARDQALEVPYKLTTYQGGRVEVRPSVATLAPGSAHVDLPAVQAPQRDAEVVTLTLDETAEYQIAQPSATVFVAGSASKCSEPALLAAHREGKSPEAFNDLVERHRAAVLRGCFQVLGNWHDAEDVCQLVFLALAQRQVQLQTTLAGWLRTVARNASIAFLRSRNRRYRYEQRAAKPEQVAPDDSRHDLRDQLDRALQLVSSPLRDAVRLRYLEGWSQLEAARLLGCPRGTLSQRAAQGVRFLRDVLSRDAD